MSNAYFQFKQFTVHQDRCAMKVCTDACLFGALIPEGSYRNVLDIGTGTGLLSLMVAQKNEDAFIDAIEIDAVASQQAAENFNASPWAKRLYAIHENILDHDPAKKYDLIISNPPFFEGDLKSSDANKNQAKHDTALTLQQLPDVVCTYLSPDGSFGILLPHHRVAPFELMALGTGLHLHKKIMVRQTPSHDFFRGILFFSKEKKEYHETEITIREGDGNYSEAFRELLKEFYLNMG